MKVARVYDYLDVRIEDAPVPAPGRDEILVRTRACGICSGDVVPWYIRKKAPIVFGHEPVGDVVEIGSGVKHLRVGDRVFHTNSIYARGLETMGGSYYLLDETALGRQEDWEEPKGRAGSVRGNVPSFTE